MKRITGRTRRWTLVALFCAAVVIIMTLTKSQEQSTDIIFVSKSREMTIDFWRALSSGARMAAEEYEADYRMEAPLKERDYEIQNKMIEEAISRRPDVIVLAPADYEVTLPAARKVKEEGIQLVLIDSVLSEDIADCVVATDNYDAGVQAGAYLASLCEEDASIGIVSHVKGNSTAIEREQGIREGMGGKVNNIVHTVYGESDYSIAYNVTKELLLNHPEITAIAATNEYSTVGAARVIKDMGLKGKVKIVGFDNSIEEIQMVEAGVIEGIVVQKSFDMGYLGVKAATELARGERVEPYIDSGAKLITKENMYTKENQKLLFPITGE